MPQITSISTQKKSGRYNVYIDNEFAFGVSEVGLTRENLYKGKEIAVEDLARLSGGAVEDKLFEKALRFLGFRSRSKREVELYLARKTRESAQQAAPPSPRLRGASVSREKIGNVLLRLENEGYLDDEAFARWWVEQRTNVRVPRGERVIKSELLQKGVAREVIEKAMGRSGQGVTLPSTSEVESAETSEVGRGGVGESAGQSQGTEVSLCLKAAEAVLPRYQNLDKMTFKRRFFGFLVRRGFGYDEVKRVVDTLARRVYTDGRS